MATTTETITEQPAVTADELFEQFFDLDCTEVCEGDYEYDVNAWACEVHRPNPEQVYALFYNQQPAKTN